MERPQLHISIEGFDGVGKTTACEKLAKLLNLEFVEKPLCSLFDSSEDYLKVRDRVNEWPERNFTAAFYGIGSLYMYHKYAGKRIVTDRHLCSNYAWSGSDDNDDIYNLLISKMGKPQLTVVLYADANTVKDRLSCRDVNDSDLKKLDQLGHIYERMREFCVSRELRTLWLHTERYSKEDVPMLISEYFYSENLPNFKEI